MHYLESHLPTALNDVFGLLFSLHEREKENEYTNECTKAAILTF